MRILQLLLRKISMKDIIIFKEILISIVLYVYYSIFYPFQYYVIQYLDAITIFKMQKFSHAVILNYYNIFIIKMRIFLDFWHPYIDDAPLF